MSTAKIRVMHLITRLIRGGADENTRHTVYGLDPDRYELDLVYGLGSEPEHLLDAARPEVNAVYLPGLCREINPWADLTTLIQLQRRMQERQYHIVHTHTAKAGILGRIAAHRAGVPVVIHTLHGATFGDFVSPLKRRLFRLLERRCAAYCQRIVSVGDDLTARYLAEGIGRPALYTTIRSGMPLADFTQSATLSVAERYALKRELGCRPTDILVGNVARLESRKGLEYFIQAARQLAPHYPQVKFLIIGDGDHRSKLEALVAMTGLGDQVLFTGFRRDIAAVMATLDIVVLTSLWEGLPRVLVQGAALGKPLVTFSVEGATEVVQDGVNGYVVPSRDVPTLTGRINYLLDRPEEATRMGAAGRALVSHDWDAATMVTQIDRLYAELLVEQGINEP